MKEKTTNKKSAKCWQEEMPQKLLAKSAKHKQFSRVTVSTDSYEIIKTPARPPAQWVRVE